MICMNSLSKVFQVPGWRLGWLITYNRYGYLDIVKDHLTKYQRIPWHPCSLIQYALPKILKETPQSYFDDYCSKLAESSYYVYEKLRHMKHIEPIKATAGLYMMVRLKIGMFTPESGITDDKSFVLTFWDQESVLLLPSSCFGESNFFRVVTCISKENADEFAVRLSRFLDKNTIKA